MKNIINLARVSRDGDRAILRVHDRFRELNIRDNTFSSDGFTSLGELLASGGWRRPTSAEQAQYLATGSIVASAEAPEISDEKAEEILDAENEFVEYSFDESYDFFALTNGNADPHSVSALFAIDYETERVYVWSDQVFSSIPAAQFAGIEQDRLLVVDPTTAEGVAQWIDDRDGTENSLDIFSLDPGEKALFESAEAEIDWGFVQTLSAIMADASGYSPAERSQNAQKQRRGPGGRFARTPGKTPTRAPKEKTADSSVIRTYLPGNFTGELVTSPQETLSDFVEGAAPSGGPGAVTAAGDIVGRDAQKATRPSEEEKTASPDIVYFAIVDPDDPKAVQSLIAISKDENGVPQAWNRNNGEWKPSPDAMADLQSITPPPLVLLDDPETLDFVLKGIDDFDAKAGAEAPEEGQESPQEAAEAPVVADAYTSEERSRNALKQRRGPDGRFVPQNTSELHEAIENRNSYVVKTYVPNTVMSESVANPRQFIEDHFIPLPENDEPEHENEAIELAEFSLTQFDSGQMPANTLYFAIVGKEDEDEVYNLIAFTHDESGIRGWFRNNGGWEQSEDVYSDFVNDTLPTLRLLTPEQATDIAVELDDFDRASHDMDVFATSEDIQRGYARYDGSFNIKTLDDVYNAVLTCSNTAPDDVKLHIAKRARSFNRMDIVPEQWRSLSSSSQNTLFGDYGEVIVASGGGRGGNEETLRQYWSNGVGAAKIRWGTNGDLTRCHRHLAKYLGSQDAWGYCQNLHQRKFGQSNYKRDNG